MYDHEEEGVRFAGEIKADDGDNGDYINEHRDLQGVELQDLEAHDYAAHLDADHDGHDDAHHNGNKDDFDLHYADNSSAQGSDHGAY